MEWKLINNFLFAFAHSMSKYYFHINQRLWHSLRCTLHFICTIEIVAYCHLLKFRTLHRFDWWRKNQISYEDGRIFISQTIASNLRLQSVFFGRDCLCIFCMHRNSIKRRTSEMALLGIEMNIDEIGILCRLWKFPKGQPLRIFQSNAHRKIRPSATSSAGWAKKSIWGGSERFKLPSKHFVFHSPSMKSLSKFNIRAKQLRFTTFAQISLFPPAWWGSRDTFILNAFE